MKRLMLFGLGVAIAAPGLAHAAESAFCIVNASDKAHVFVTETREGVRQVEDLAPGGKLCATDTQAEDGIVSVFESRDALEGCSRIIARGVTEELFSYAEFDRCEWSSHRQ